MASHQSSRNRSFANMHSTQRKKRTCHPVPALQDNIMPTVKIMQIVAQYGHLRLARRSAIHLNTIYCLLRQLGYIYFLYFHNWLQNYNFFRRIKRISTENIHYLIIALFFNILSAIHSFNNNCRRFDIRM